MMRFWIALALATAAACTPPASTTAPAEAPASEAPSAPSANLGPYTNTWDSAEFSRFRHTLRAATPGAHMITLQALTDSPGGETVAVYPVGADGERRTVRIAFVVADTGGSSAEESVEIPAEGLPVEVVVENAGGRRHAGGYTITVAP
ncbi:MAG: hypothetical protein ACT4OF_14625 [Caulobacteraceae bacterium]